MIIHQCTITSVAHTFSLSIHTYTHTPTPTQSKSGRYELIRFLEVEEIDFQSRLEEEVILKVPAILSWEDYKVIAIIQSQGSIQKLTE